MSLKQKILSTMNEIAEMTGSELVADLNDQTVLLDSGLDSLGFAILISRLEELLGYDPFTMMTTPVYPKTFAELVSIYERFA